MVWHQLRALLLSNYADFGDGTSREGNTHISNLRPTVAISQITESREKAFLRFTIYLCDIVALSLANLLLRPELK